MLTKVDQAPRQCSVDAIAGADAIETSVRGGTGLDTVLDRLRVLACNLAQPGLAAVGATAVRVAESMRTAGAALDRARLVNRQRCEELIAAEVRVALDELGKVGGAVATDDVLERIFSRFCIGK